MQYNENVDLPGGIFEVELLRDGKYGPQVIQRREVHNLVTTAGKTKVWKIVSGLNTTEIYDQMRIGTCAAQPTGADTNVKAAVGASLRTVNLKTMSGKTLVLVLSYPSGSTSITVANIREVAVLAQHTSPGGTGALSRATFAAVNKTKSDKLKITYSVKIT